LQLKDRLKKDLPDLKAGVIFEHRKYDKKYPDRGNIGCGVLILGWIDGNCQGGWCGETYIFPGQLAKNREWFEPVHESEKEKILAEIESLKERVKKLL
jgi:hypothetical protein